MKTTQRKLFIVSLSVLLICVSVMMCSCFLFKHIEDTNGEDDYSLCSITEEQICSGATNVIVFGSVTRNTNTQTEYSVKKMSGVKVIYKVNADVNTTYVYEITTTLASGNLRVCFINNGRIIRDVQINQTEYIELNNLSGKTELCVAAESAAFSITIR